MPLVQPSPWIHPHLVYEAPVNDKTLEVRRQFDVDEKTGYPRHYNWRAIAQLGPEHPPEAVFTSLTKASPEQFYSTKLVAGALIGIGCAGVGCFFNLYRGRPLWAACHSWIAAAAVSAYGMNWLHERTLVRSARKNQIFLDYVRKHPERFEQVHRPKVREALFLYPAVRV